VRFPIIGWSCNFEYSDAPIGARNFWLVAKSGEIDLCRNEPGFEVDVMICNSLKAMTKVWICEEYLKEAQNKAEIKIMEVLKLTAKLQDWLRASAISKLESLGALTHTGLGHSQKEQHTGEIIHGRKIHHQSVFKNQLSCQQLLA